MHVSLEGHRFKLYMKIAVLSYPVMSSFRLGFYRMEIARWECPTLRESNAK